MNSSSPAASLRGAVRAFSAAEQQFERALAVHMCMDHVGLSVINHVLIHGETTPSHLARAVCVSPAAMSAVLQRLEDGEHILRKRHPNDGRKVLISVTPATRDRAMKRVVPLIRGIAEIAENLNGRDRHVVERTLLTLADLYRPDEEVEGDAKATEPEAENDQRGEVRA